MINSVQETAITLASNTSNIPFSTDVVITKSANCCGTEMDYTVATANAYGNVSANRQFRICGNGSTTITVGSLASNGTTATQIPLVKNASLIIKRIA